MNNLQTQIDPNAGTTPPCQPIDVDPAVLQEWMREGDCVLIDVREPFEHAAERIELAVSIPLSSMDPQSLRERFPDKRLVFHCAGGKRSAQACKRFSEVSGQPTPHLAGGIEAWKQSLLPTRKPAKAGLPIMRQVQIAAGALVLLGVVLGLAVSAWFLALSGFVGAGLVFAGITGWCGMAKLLAKLPWNATANPAACSIKP